MVNGDDLEDEEDGRPFSPPSSSSSSSSSSVVGGGLDQLLHLASQLKSQQPEVREKRQRWEALTFYQRNTLLFHREDGCIRYDGCVGMTKSTSSTVNHSDNSTSQASDQTERFKHSYQFKSKAGLLFKKGDYEGASMNYQRAIGLFQWARKFHTPKEGDEIEWNDMIDPSQSRPNRDDLTSSSRLMELFEKYPPSLDQVLSTEGPAFVVLPKLSTEAHQRASEHIFTCLINIAACEEKRQEWQQVIQVCQTALAMKVNSVGEKTSETIGTIESSSSSSSFSNSSFPPLLTLSQLTSLKVKALFRCAMAYNELDDLDHSIPLLERAAKLAPKDALIAKELVKLQQFHRQQRMKDEQSFGGLFDRGEIFDHDETGNVRSSFHANQSGIDNHFSAATSPSASATSSSSNSTAAKDDRTKKFIEEYLTGFRQQANIEKQKKNGANRRNVMADSTPGDEFDAEVDTSAAALRPPTLSDLASVYSDARRNFGIDLSDPIVQQELKRLQEEHRRTGKTYYQREEEANEKRKKDERTKNNANASTTRQSATKSSLSSSSNPIPTDFTSSNLIGPVLFSLIILLCLKWIGIVP